MRKTTQFFSDIKQFFLSSSKELKSTRTMVLCAMMAALSIILSTTISFYITPTIKIGFSGIPNRLVDYMFGPVTGAFFGGMMDILKFLIKPDGGFFPGYTLSAMLGGLIYGTALYKCPNKSWMLFVRILIAEILVKIGINICLNTLWSSMLLGKGFLALLPARLLKNLVQIPVDTIFLFAVLTLFKRLKRYLFNEY